MQQTCPQCGSSWNFKKLVVVQCPNPRCRMDLQQKEYKTIEEALQDIANIAKQDASILLDSFRLVNQLQDYTSGRFSKEVRVFKYALAENVFQKVLKLGEDSEKDEKIKSCFKEYERILKRDFFLQDMCVNDILRWCYLLLDIEIPNQYKRTRNGGIPRHRKIQSDLRKGEKC